MALRARARAVEEAMAQRRAEFEAMDATEFPQQVDEHPKAANELPQQDDEPPKEHPKQVSEHLEDADELQKQAEQESIDVAQKFESKLLEEISGLALPNGLDVGNIDFEKELMKMFKSAKFEPEKAEAPTTTEDKIHQQMLEKHAVLAKAAEQNFEFPAGSSAGRAFGRFIAKHWSEEKQDQYWKLSNLEKGRWRAQWGKEQYDLVVRSKQTVESYDETDTCMYEDLNWDALVVAEGGHRPSVIKGCLTIVKNLIKKGPPFVSIDEDSGRLLFKRKRKYSKAERRNGQLTLYLQEWRLLKRLALVLLILVLLVLGRSEDQVEDVVTVFRRAQGQYQWISEKSATETEWAWAKNEKFSEPLQKASEYLESCTKGGDDFQMALVVGAEEVLNGMVPPMLRVFLDAELPSEASSLTEAQVLFDICPSFHAGQLLWVRGVGPPHFDRFITLEEKCRILGIDESIPSTIADAPIEVIEKAICDASCPGCVGLIVACMWAGLKSEESLCGHYKGVLKQMGGKDATAASAASHKSALAANLMWEFCIGSVVRFKAPTPEPGLARPLGLPVPSASPAPNLRSFADRGAVGKVPSPRPSLGPPQTRRPSPAKGAAQSGKSAGVKPVGSSPPLKDQPEPKVGARAGLPGGCASSYPHSPINFLNQ
ncbi:unnamed protein product [Prorocentrum cordatum]|uniref:Uncharacterized protein n=1 Tax=Prorocentrum cordatum TaxID=2364126 RepID=A0ABN9PZE3_9DINO|nr:unnamed protein product [Polarella glacialis]